MRVVVHQPDFIPYLGFFHRLLSADIYVVLDHIQISTSGWVHRDKIKTAQGEGWVTLPVKHIKQRPQICDATIDYTNKHYQAVLNLLEQNYRHAEYYRQVYDAFKAVYTGAGEKLVDVNCALLSYLMDVFDTEIKCVRSSELDVEGTKSQMVADIVKSVGGTVYISGIGARDYHDDAPFKTNGITVEWQKFRHPVYKQLHGEFISYLSSIDLLFNCGIDRSREILRSC